MAENCIYATFGRFQPPTKGHEANFDGLKDKADQAGCPFLIYVSQQHDPSTKGWKNKYPLTREMKLKWLKKGFPHYASKFVSDPYFMKGVIYVCKHIANKKPEGQIWDHLVLVFGDAEAKQFKSFVPRYNMWDYPIQFDANGNAKENPKAEFTFGRIEIQSSGKRLDGDKGDGAKKVDDAPDAPAAQKLGGEEKEKDGKPVADGKVSGTNLRKHAQNGDLDEFQAMCPSGIAKSDKLAQDYMNDLRVGMKLPKIKF